MHPETVRTERTISNNRYKKAADVGMLSYDTEDAMTCIDNKYGLHELSNLY